MKKIFGMMMLTLAVSGCARDHIVIVPEVKDMAQTVYDDSREIAFINLVLHVRVASNTPQNYSRATDLMHDAGMVRECKKTRCFFKYNRKYVTFDHEWIYVEYGNKYMKFQSIDDAVKEIYG